MVLFGRAHTGCFDFHTARHVLIVKMHSSTGKKNTPAVTSANHASISRELMLMLKSCQIPNAWSYSVSASGTESAVIETQADSVKKEKTKIKNEVKAQFITESGKIYVKNPD